MRPAFSIVCFTTLIGLGQGVLVALALAVLSQQPMAQHGLSEALWLAELLLGLGLLASFFHLGHKTRAWRAVLMWRTSWMSREVIVLPTYMGLVALWWCSFESPRWHAYQAALAVAVLVMSFVLWYCTAMIYACLRFVQEWAHGLTVAHFMAIGLSSGFVLACAWVSVWSSQVAPPLLTTFFAPMAWGLTSLAWACRCASLRRNARLRPKSSLQTATGIQSKKLVQTSMGMSAGAFNTREFFHGLGQRTLRHIRWGFQLALFAIPLLLMTVAWASPHDSMAPWLWWLAVASQVPGLLAERWLFFAQAQHPQNLYYQTVS